MNLKMVSVLLLFVAIGGAAWYFSIPPDDGIQSKGGDSWVEGIQAVASLVTAVGGLIGSVTALVLALRKGQARAAE